MTRKLYIDLEGRAIGDSEDGVKLSDDLRLHEFNAMLEALNDAAHQRPFGPEILQKPFQFAVANHVKQLHDEGAAVTRIEVSIKNKTTDVLGFTVAFVTKPAKTTK